MPLKGMFSSITSSYFVLKMDLVKTDFTQEKHHAGKVCVAGSSSLMYFNFTENYPQFNNFIHLSKKLLL